MNINIETLRLNLLEETWAYEDRKMLPKSSKSYYAKAPYIQLDIIEDVLKQLRAEGLIDGTEMWNKNYLVLGITDLGMKALKLSGRFD